MWNKAKLLTVLLVAALGITTLAPAATLALRKDCSVERHYHGDGGRGIGSVEESTDFSGPFDRLGGSGAESTSPDNSGCAINDRPDPSPSPHPLPGPGSASVHAPNRMATQ